MSYTTLISAAELQDLLTQKDVRLIDCRFRLNDTEAGRTLYLEEHIPGALYAHLDTDLSRPVVAGETGRHPLPAAAVMVERLSQWGIDEQVQVVAYDDMSGAIAARLWWLLKWLGHKQVAVLEGGWQAWQAAGGATENGQVSVEARVFTPHERPELLVDAAAVAQSAGRSTHTVVDSRTPERYRGEEEPIDPVAGHIPGAINLPHPENVLPDGSWKTSKDLQERFHQAISTPADHTIFYCGSGVTACRNILAYEHAGLGEALLYPGSWSEWITDKNREIAIGEERD